MKIESGKLYRTRCKLKARIYATDGEGTWCIHGAVLTEQTGWVIQSWNSRGAFHNNSESHIFDIVGEWREKQHDTSRRQAYFSKHSGSVFMLTEAAARDTGMERAPWLDEPQPEMTEIMGS